MQGGAEKPLRVYGYCRVSTDTQGEQGTSLDSQRDEILAYCRSQGYPEPTIYTEIESGGEERLSKRVELTRLMREVRAGDLVVVAKQDRWTRSTLHFLQSTAELTKRGVRFFSLAERFDPALPEGKMASAVMAMVSEQERSRILARTQQGRKRLRRTGELTEGHPPVGYTRKDRTFVVDEAGAKLVREMYRLCVAGWSTPRLAAKFGKGQSSVMVILRNRTYTGETQTDVDSNLWLVTHEAIVDKATWLAAQSALSSRMLGGRPLEGRSRTAGWLLRGIARCAECNARMGAGYGKTTASDVYICQRRKGLGAVCRAPRANRVAADVAAERLVVARLDDLRGALSALPKKRKPSPGAPMDLQRQRLRKRRDALIDLAVDGLVAKDDLRARLADIDRDIERIEQPAPAPEVTAKDMRATLAVVGAMRRSWDEWDVEERRKAIGLLAREVLFRDGAPVFVWKTPEELAAPRAN